MESAGTYHTHAVIISIGDEITQGEALDTNTQWLAQQLVARGVGVSAHVTAPDDLATLVRALREASDRAPLVICTGGLGPTDDDLTRRALADASGEELVRDEGALDALRAWFSARGRDVLEMNAVQAMRPARGRCLTNPHGTAPGIFVRIGESDVYAMPGPPREMRPMFDEHVAPDLRPNPAHTIVMRSILTAGISESNVAQRLGELTARDRNPNVATTASLGLVTCRLRYEGPETDDARRALDELESRVREGLGAYAFATGETTIQAHTVERLKARGAALVTAESCTGGMVSELITGVPGCSSVYLGGCVAYHNESKIAQLGVKRETIERYGAVSERTAREMAHGLIERYAIDGFEDEFGVSITGVAGPSGGTEEKPVGTVYIGLAHRDADGAISDDIRRFRFPGSRADIRRRTSVSALMMLIRLIEGEPAPELLWQSS